MGVSHKKMEHQTENEKHTLGSLYFYLKIVNIKHKLVWNTEGKHKRMQKISSFWMFHVIWSIFEADEKKKSPLPKCHQTHTQIIVYVDDCIAQFPTLNF